MTCPPESAPQPILVGYRPDVSPYAGQSLLLYLEAGLRLRDPQSAIRVYPPGLVEFLRLDPAHPTFHTEVLVRAAWAGVPIREIPAVSAAALPHSRWYESALVHARLLLRVLLPLSHRQWQPIDVQTARRSHWSTFFYWLNPLRAWRDLRAGHIGRFELAAAIAVGVFIANLPLYGLQTLLALYTARRLHLHPVPVVAGSQISTPPIGPVMIAAAITVGHLLTHGSFPSLDSFAFRHLTFSQIVGPLLVDWLLGSIVVGVAMAVVAFFVTAALCRFSFPSTPRPIDLPN